MKFAVGVLLSGFGTFWVGEGAGATWVGGEWAIVGLMAAWLGIAWGWWGSAGRGPGLGRWRDGLGEDGGVRGLGIVCGRWLVCGCDCGVGWVGDGFGEGGSGGVVVWGGAVCGVGRDLG